MSADDPKTAPDPEDPQLAELAGKILEGVAVDWSTTTGAASPYLDELKALDALARLSREAAAPTEWGHLKLLESVGEGSSGKVFRAWDTRLDREVALKLLRPSETQETGTTIIDEGRLLARVRHPNVVTVYGAERIDGLVGIWTEFVHGETLAALVQREGVVSEERACEIGATLCSALSAIHRAGVVHGDVKAQNVLLEPGGRLVLVDLGTAGEHSMDAGGVTSGPLSGTPLYMAPELWRYEPPTPQSDIYSLGVLLYFLVTGKFPIRGATIDEVRSAHANSQSHPIDEYRADLQAAFVSAVERALSRDRHQRFASADSFQAALEHANPTFIKRRRRNVIGVGAALAIVAGLSVLSWLWLRPRTTDTAPDQRLQQFTHRPLEQRIFTSAISPDGRLVAFADAAGVQVETIDTHDVHEVALPLDIGGIIDLGWLSDSSTLLTATDGGIWRTPALGETKRIATIGGLFSVSPDGRYLAVNPKSPGRIIVMSATGDEGKVIVPPAKDGGFGRPSWSPDGSRIAYRKTIGPARVGIVSRPWDGGDETTALEVPGLFQLIWAPDGRILYSCPQSPPSRYLDLWSVEVDAKTGLRLGDPTAVVQREYQTFRNPSITRDGRELVFTNSALENHVYAASFDPVKIELGRPQRMSSMSNFEQPSSWWSDDELLFRVPGGSLSRIYAQSLERSSPHLLMPSLGDVIDATMSPDGRWLVYLRFHQNGVMRLSAAEASRSSDGSAAEKVFDYVGGSNDRIRCARPGNPVCVIGSRPPDGATTQIVSFSPQGGEPTRHAILPSAVWDLSPDGAEVVGLDPSNVRGPLVVLNLATNQLTYVQTLAVTGAQWVCWVPASNGWIVAKSIGADRGQVWYVDRSGNTKLLPGTETMALSQPIASPDGHHIAFARGFIDSNVWILQRF